MISGGWRYAAASVIGTSHTKQGTNCQDANDCQIYQLPTSETVLVGVVSDGAGSARFGGEGAALCCSTLQDLVCGHVGNGNAVEQISSTTAGFWLNAIRRKLEAAAESESHVLREYACTLLAAIIGEHCAAFVQIGDGVMVVADSEEPHYGHIFWPDRGEYENTTHFVTEERACDHLQFDLVQRHILELAMLSDGLQRLALHYRSQTAYQPFFGALFDPIRKAAPGRAEDVSISLNQFLLSDRVNQKTDDDKTLVLATRPPRRLLPGSVQLEHS